MRIFTSTKAHRLNDRTAGNPIRSMLAVAGAFVIAVSLGVAGAGVSYALLNASATVTGAGLTAGTANITVNGEPINLTNLYPGQSAMGQFTVTNTGNVDLNLTVTSIAGPTAANALVVTVAQGACVPGGSGIATGALGGAAIPRVIGSTFSSALLCLYVSMPTTAPASAIGGQATLITASIQGIQTGTAIP